MLLVNPPIAAWHVVWTAPRAERKVRDHLERQGFATFLPLDRRRLRRKRPGRGIRFVVEWYDVPRFPRYVFFGIGAGQSIYSAAETPGVVSVLTVADGPLVVPDPVMQELMAEADDRGIIGREDTTKRARLSPGSRVVLGSGSAMAGFIAEVARDEGKEIRVFFEILGGRREVSVVPEHIQPAL